MATHPFQKTVGNDTGQQSPHQSANWATRNVQDIIPLASLF